MNADYIKTLNNDALSFSYKYIIINVY